MLKEIIMGTPYICVYCTCFNSYNCTKNSTYRYRHEIM